MADAGMPMASTDGETVPVAEIDKGDEGDEAREEKGEGVTNEKPGDAREEALPKA